MSMAGINANVKLRLGFYRNVQLPFQPCHPGSEP